ncbi:MAG: dipeptidyl aminopeptidase/acylaminoacyl peptidase [Rhodothermales bacterium]|jgi:dipeptidyl aminopeptidase/acylaminoacyl peptidase
MNSTYPRTPFAVVFALLLVFNIGGVQAEEPILAKDLLKQYQLSEPVISPDGQRIAVAVTDPVKGDKQNSSIWLYEKAADRFRQLTTAGSKDNSPKWSPDGQTLAFLSQREEEKPQIFLLPMSGGEANRLSKAISGVGKFEWSPDGNSIAFLAEKDLNKEPEQDVDSKDDEIVVSESFKATKLWCIEIASQEVQEILENGDWTVADFAWLPSNEQFVVTANNAGKPELLTDELFIVDRGDGKMRGLGKPDGPIHGLQVSPDGKTLAYVGVSDGGPEPHDLYLQSVSGGTSRNLTSAIIDRPISSFVWRQPDSFVLLTDDGFGSALYRMDATGKVGQRKNYSGFQLSNIAVNETLQVSVRSSAVTPPELWITDEAGERQVSKLHPVSPLLIAPEIFRYSSDGGLEIEAALFLPSQTQRSPLPLITLVHGGPTGRWSHKINDWAQLLVSRGYAVFAPNIRGSIGYGLSFVRSNRHDWGGGDYRDVMAGIDSLIARGIADPERLGIGGWSYGGYMSAWAITQTDRFKVAVIGAPMTDLAVEYGTEIAEINAYDTWFLGTPYENLDEFTRMSPMTHIRNVRTPSLILVGEDDQIDPPAQCWQFYRGLRRYDVDAELVIYPRELHSIQEELHKLDVLERMTGWFERYLN